MGSAPPDSTLRVRGGTLGDPYAGLSTEERVKKKRAEQKSSLPAAPDLTDELLQKSASSTVARLRRGMGRRSTFLDTAVGDSTLLGDL